MFHRKVIALLLVCVFICISVFGQDVTAVKKFERARKTVPVAISLNFFGFGIGSFMQGDIKSALIQAGISTVGYTMLFVGGFGDFRREVEREEAGHTFKEKEPNWAIKGTIMGVGTTLLFGNMFFGTWRATTYQFDKQFDDFYNINNDASWPAARGN